MRLLLALTFVLGLSFSVYAQRSVGDSVIYYERMYGRYAHRLMDSIAKSDTALLVNARVRELKLHSKSYVAFMLYGEAAAADFSAFNKAIAQDGFGPFKGPDWRIGIGVSRKTYSGLMIDFNYLLVGLNQSEKINGEKISASFQNFFELEFGYACVNTRRFTVYPYAGLSARLAYLSYDKPAVITPGFRSIASLIQNNQSADGSNTHLGYEAGLGIDYAIFVNKHNSGGTMLFAKFGTDGIFGNENYTISGTTIRSGIKYGAWIAQFGFKFFGRP